MNVPDFLDAHTAPFLQIFVRISGIFLFAPIFSMTEMPMTVKGGMTAGLALVIYPIVSPFVARPEAMDAAFLLTIADQALIGALIGLVLLVYYTAFLLAGEFYSLQMGFGIINVIDPLSQTSIPILGQLKSMFALVIFTVVNGHLMLIESLVYSFKALPGLTLGSAPTLASGMIQMCSEMFVIAFQMAAPVMGTVFLIELVMGIMSRVAPQMNVMVIGFQIKIIAGMLVLMMLTQSIAPFSQRIFARCFQMTGALVERL